MKARECQECGAPLPEAAIGESVTCAFCGTVYDSTTTIPRSMKVKLDPGTGQRMLWIITAAILVPILGVLAITCVITYGIVSSVDKAVDIAKTGTANRATIISAKRSTTIKPSELGGKEGVGWQTLDCMPPPGGVGNLEAVAAIPWAVSLAQSWRKDARLYRVDVDKLRPDGLVNAQVDEASSVQYRLASPSQLEELRRQADLGQSDVKTGLFIEIKQGKVQALVTGGGSRGEILPPHPVSLPLKQILDGMERAGALPAKPFYSGYLIYLPPRNGKNEGWVWYLNTLSRQEEIPRVRASDGKPYPYR